MMNADGSLIEQLGYQFVCWPCCLNSWQIDFIDADLRFQSNKFEKFRTFCDLTVDVILVLVFRYNVLGRQNIKFVKI